jgi:hypothetical protein
MHQRGEANALVSGSQTAPHAELLNFSTSSGTKLPPRCGVMIVIFARAAARRRLMSAASSLLTTSAPARGELVVHLARTTDASPPID